MRNVGYGIFKNVIGYLKSGEAILNCIIIKI